MKGNENLSQAIEPELCCVKIQAKDPTYTLLHSGATHVSLPVNMAPRRTITYQTLREVPVLSFFDIFVKCRFGGLSACFAHLSAGFGDLSAGFAPPQKKMGRKKKTKEK